MRRKIIKKSSEEGINYLKQKNAGLNLIDKIYYINLDHRTDRLESIKKEISLIDPKLEKSERISAVKEERGEIGCGKSHLLALKDAEKNKYKNVLILEDDFIFKESKDKVNQILKDLIKIDKDYNMFLLGKNLMKYRNFRSDFVEVIDAQTTSGYLISDKFIPKLIENFEFAVNNLEKGASQKESSIDICWKKLQQPGGKIYTTLKPIGIQRESYSDIEKRNIFYTC